MANEQDDNVGSLTQVKQLTASIRFESEDVRRQVEQMLGKYQDVADILGKTRELTRGELELAKEYVATIAKLPAALGEHLKDLSEGSRAMAALEASTERYTAQAEKAERVSGRLSGLLKGARAELTGRGANVAAAQEQHGAAFEREQSYHGLRNALVEAREGKTEKLTAALGDEGEGKTPKEMRRLGNQKLLAERAAIASDLGGDSSDASAVKTLRAELILREKAVQAAKKDEELAAKRVESLKAQRKLAEQIKVKHDEGAKSSQASLSAHEKLIPQVERRLARESKRFAQTEHDAEDEGGSGGGGRPRSIAGHYGRRYAGSLGLNLLSDVGIPGVSDMARMERYRRLTVDAASRFSARRGGGEEGDEGGGGMGGLLGAGARALASPIGLAVGGAAVAGGYVVSKFNEAKADAGAMTGTQRTLMGQVGQGGLGAANAAYRQDLTDYGIDTRTAQADLVRLNQQVGGRAGGGQLRQAAALGQAFGQDVGEVGGQAGTLMRAGGASPMQAVKSLQTIMMEGVKAGMDRARITEFTSEVIGIQEQLLRETGANNSQSIARSLAQFMGASGKQGQEFFQSAEFQGIKGIDQGVRNFGRGADGPGAGLIFRTFSGESEGDTPGERYLSLLKNTEQGLLGGDDGSGKGGVARTKKIVAQAFEDAGAGDLFERKAAGKSKEFTPEEKSRYKQSENVVRVNLLKDFGVGAGQSEALLKLLDNINAKIVSKEGQKEIKSAMEDMAKKSADPLVALGSEMAKTSKSLSDISVDTGAIHGFMALEKGKQALNQAAKPAVVAFGDLVGDSVDVFGSAVKHFNDSVDFLSKIFGKQEATPEETSKTNKGLLDMTGKGTNEFKDAAGTHVFDMMFGMLRKSIFGASDAEKHKDSESSRLSPTGVPLDSSGLEMLLKMTPQQLKDLGQIMKDHGNNVKENTAALKHANAQRTFPGRNVGNTGVSIGGKQ